jgi:integrase
VFTGRHGGPVSRHALYQVIKDAGKAAGVPWAGVHTLRHTYATRLFREGIDAVRVSRLLGHHDPGFTLARYVHLLDGDLDHLPEPPFLDLLTDTEDAVEVDSAEG